MERDRERESEQETERETETHAGEKKRKSEHESVESQGARHSQGVGVYEPSRKKAPEAKTVTWR